MCLYFHCFHHSLSVVFDYMAVPPNVTFGVNMTTTELRIPLVNDDTAEPDEQLTVNLAEFTPNVVIANFTSIVTVIDDDCEFNIVHKVKINAIVSLNAYFITEIVMDLVIPVHY